MILTGFGALNKLLGKTVYTSQELSAPLHQMNEAMVKLHEEFALFLCLLLQRAPTDTRF